MNQKTPVATVFVIASVLYATSTLAFDTFRYKVNADDAQLIIYPSDVKLSLRQKHAVLFRLAMEMKADSSRDLAEFVQISLYEMANLYEELAVNPDNFTEKTVTDRKKQWRNETINLANRLYAAAASVSPGMDMDISLNDTGDLLITVSDNIYILSNPVINKPHLLDQRIIEAVCRNRYCNPDEINSREIMAKRSIVIEAAWAISEGKKPVFSTRDGLHFEFNNLDRRSEKQIASLKLIREIRLITELLNEANRKGVLLNWDKMTARQLFGSYDYRIQINDFGDSIYIRLPELAHVQDWQRLVFPWIRAMIENDPVDQYLDGDALLAYALDKKPG